MRDVYIAGAFMTRFDRHFDRSLGSLAREAAEGALGDASVTADAVEFVAFGNAAAGILTGQEMIRAQTALAGSGLEGAPMINVENACASASSAFHLAFNAIRSGQHEVALAVGAEKMNVADRNLANVALARAVDVEELVAEQGDSVLSEGAGPLFMEIYAGFARDYMDMSGATQLDLATAAAKNR
ncbi:MAG: beta-ketoacyl synthase N-terminal-like domain-containing protein, partial [Gammaproteobacteria bacterium]|nr:beta-ketoacyl synthase N-terminal-like domain-containing protein [Gammaproteobacteria bacterium]